MRKTHTGSVVGDHLQYCEDFVVFLTDLVSQLPTRRYTNTLLKDVNLLTVATIAISESAKHLDLLRDLLGLLKHFSDFAVEESIPPSASGTGSGRANISSLQNLQRVAGRLFQTKLKVLSLSNLASIESRSDLVGLIGPLNEAELHELCHALGLRTEYPKGSGIVANKNILMETFVTAFERRATLQETIAQMTVLPTEQTLYDARMLENEDYNNSVPLSIPRLNLQYLNFDDFVWRSFQLHRAEAYFDIRKDIEAVVKKMSPRVGRDREFVFGGFSKMALPMNKPAIIEVAPPQVGESFPAFVKAEVLLDVSRLGDALRAEWDALRPGDIVFFAAVKAEEQPTRVLTDGHSSSHPSRPSNIAHIRTAELIQMQDEQGRPIRTFQQSQANGFSSRDRQRRLVVHLDTQSYVKDVEVQSTTKVDILSKLNVVIRRRGRENNFRPILETIQSLSATEQSLPEWLQDVLLGYGNPEAATYTHLDDKISIIDFRDTFLDWDHLVSAFPQRAVEVVNSTQDHLTPPYKLELFSLDSYQTSRSSKKRRRDETTTNESPYQHIRASTYAPPNTGPYLNDMPKLNKIRFTQAQTEAIISGTQPGLSVIVGPPGTGKTDTVTQMINLLYHNNPEERILLLAHSNQALNQLFQKIMALEIDSRHLLRLGHGEEELDSDESFSKAGRVESFMEDRNSNLSEVARLAASIGVEGAHGNSCETADYFNKVHIEPAWSRFWDVATSKNMTPENVVRAFPFAMYFSDLSAPLFPKSPSLASVNNIAAGCQHHIRKIFGTLASIRPFELLRTPRSKEQYLLSSQARIVAMTTTHAAMNRQQIADAGLRYSSLIMEEAAQITELESCIPLVLQRPLHSRKGGINPLKRVILVGDHLQNSPVVQNRALAHYANLDQSLFLRLVRLGVPTITLNAQGRCRPSLARLFSWRYKDLVDLPHLIQKPEFARANAGLRFDYQFIDIPDYQGQGEHSPSPHFIQNLGEAEYAAALFQYMRLLGYPAKKISILTTYAGQCSLIRDVLGHRCKGNRLFGMPRHVSTVDRYQGEQNDYIILSMVRTRALGYLRDIRRLTVALSRARLGLYILGRKDLFDTSAEMAPAMKLLNERPSKLMIVTGEMFPTDRKLGDKVPEAQHAEMDGIEHLGQYVFEMTQAKVKAMGGNVQVMKDTSGEVDEYGNAEFEAEAPAGEVANDDDPDLDPLHENLGLAWGESGRQI